MELRKGKGLQALLEIAPYQGSDWLFDDDENFRFERSFSEQLGTEEDWLDGLGVRASKISMVATVTHDDWTNLIRKEAVRLGKPLNVTAIPQGNLLRLPCVAHWDTKAWTIQFENPDWVQLKYEAIFTSERPSWNEVEETVLEAVLFGNSKLLPKSTASLNQTFSVQPGCNRLRS